jgi:hypothetical protein
MSTAVPYIFTWPKSDGTNAAAYELHFFEPGGAVTPKAVYTDSTASVVLASGGHANTPLVLDAYGSAIFWTIGKYYIRLVKDDGATVVWTQDNWSPQIGAIWLNDVLNKNTSFTVTAAEAGTLYICAGTLTATLPPIASVQSGTAYLFYGDLLSTQLVTIEGAGADSINGYLNLHLLANESCVVVAHTAYSLWVGYAVPRHAHKLANYNKISYHQIYDTDANIQSVNTALYTLPIS